MEWVLIVFAILIAGGLAAFVFLQKNGARKEIRQIGPTTQERPTVSVSKGSGNASRSKANTAKTAQLSALRDRLAAGGGSSGTPAAKQPSLPPLQPQKESVSADAAESSWTPEEAGLESQTFMILGSKKEQPKGGPAEMVDGVANVKPMEGAPEIPDVSAAKSASAAKAQSDRAKILLVDDSKVVRVKTEKLLEANGYEVLSAVDGLDALAKLESFRPDAIITDIEMPNLDGFGLVRNVRGNEKTAKIPIIVMTSHVNLHLDIAATEGINGFLPKPFNEQDMLDQVAFLVE